MQNREKIEPSIAYLNSISDSPLVVNEQDLDKILEKSNTKQQPIIIKILIIIGAILTCVFSLGFLLLIGLYDSSIGMIFTGLIMLFAAVFLTLKSQAIFLDTILLSCYCAGFGLLGVGLFIETESPSIISMVLLILSLITLYISKNYIILFTSIFIALGSTKVLISQISPILDMLYYCGIAFLTVYVLFNEAKLIGHNKKLLRLYDPAKTAIIICLILLYTRLPDIFFLGAHVSEFEISIMEFAPEIMTVFYIGLILFITSKILNKLEVNNYSIRISIFIAIAIILAPSLYAPSISVSLLVILACFYSNYKTGLGIGILAFIYFISRFYYDMNITLLDKSIALMITGVIFLIVYYFTNKYLSSNEKD